MFFFPKTSSSASALIAVSNDTPYKARRHVVTSSSVEFITLDAFIGELGELKLHYFLNRLLLFLFFFSPGFYRSVIKMPPRQTKAALGNLSF